MDYRVSVNRDALSVGHPVTYVVSKKTCMIIMYVTPILYV